MATVRDNAQMSLILKRIKIFVRMTRYRVAVMLLLFFVFGLAFGENLTSFEWEYILAIIALVSSYVSATTVNDLADEKIDKINHPSSPGRPLVMNFASRSDLIYVHVYAVLLTLVSSLLISKSALLILCISVAINYIYSLPPLKLSYRTYFAPLILSVAYVLIPYFLGAEISGRQIQGQEYFFLATLFILFVGRILLKDFRDRKGDAAFGKPTYLLRFGKTVTCITSFICIVASNVLLLASFWYANIAVKLCIEILFIAIYVALYNLAKEKDTEREQIYIGIGAKMGNGLLVTILSIVVLKGYTIPEVNLILFCSFITLIFLSNFFMLIRHPEKAIIGYRG